jgi:hypothetical protein
VEEEQRARKNAERRRLEALEHGGVSVLRARVR